PLTCIVVTLLFTTLFVGLATPAAAATHRIEYQVGLPQSMVDDGEIQYFGAHGFTTVYFVAGAEQTYTNELNIIKSLGMKPVIDLEFVISDSSTPISTYDSYFQSLKDAGWQYAASELGRQGDASHLRQYFSEYTNFNCDNCGLYQGIYKDPSTTRNSWESYYTSEWPSIQSGTKTAASLGIKNGLLAGVWANDNGNNQILTNSLNGRSPSYKSMLDWSYANGVGFTSFGVWFHPGPGTPQVPDYKQLGFEKIISNLQTYYPASGSWTPPTRVADAQTFTVTQVASDTYTFSGTLKELVSGNPIPNAPVNLHVYTSSAGKWELFPGSVPLSLPAGEINPTKTDANGAFSWANVKLPAGTYLFRSYYTGDTSHMESFAPSYQGTQVTSTPSSGATILTITSPTGTPSSGATYTVAGDLRDSSNKPIANAPVDVFVDSSDTGSYHWWEILYTDANGHWTTTDHHTSAGVYYEARFWGDGPHTPAEADRWVPIG
ncbi:MAG: hypothetical protein ACXV4B_08155, partial [Halobacteriota archaeon]